MQGGGVTDDRRKHRVVIFTRLVGTNENLSNANFISTGDDESDEEVSTILQLSNVFAC